MMKSAHGTWDRNFRRLVIGWGIAALVAVAACTLHCIVIAGIWHGKALETCLRITPVVVLLLASAVCGCLSFYYIRGMASLFFSTAAALLAYMTGDVMLDHSHWVGGAFYFAIGHCIYGLPGLFLTTDSADGVDGASTVLRFGVFVCFPLLSIVLDASPSGSAIVIAALVLYGCTLGFAYYRADIMTGSPYTRLASLGFILFAISDVVVFCIYRDVVIETVKETIFVRVLYTLALLFITLDDVMGYNRQVKLAKPLA